MGLRRFIKNNGGFKEGFHSLNLNKKSTRVFLSEASADAVGLRRIEQ